MSKDFIYMVDNAADNVRQKMRAGSLIEAARKFMGTEVAKTTGKTWDCRVRKYNEGDYENILSEGFYKVK